MMVGALGTAIGQLKKAVYPCIMMFAKTSHTHPTDEKEKTALKTSMSSLRIRTKSYVKLGNQSIVHVFWVRNRLFDTICFLFCPLNFL
jgi:hypothetical protein